MKLAKHILDSPVLTEVAVRELAKWLYEYSDMFDFKNASEADARSEARKILGVDNEH